MSAWRYTPTQTRKKLLAAKAKQNTMEAGPSTVAPTNAQERRLLLQHRHLSAPSRHQCMLRKLRAVRRHHRSLWLGFENIEKFAQENGRDPLLCVESIQEKVTRDMSRSEATELDQVSVSFPRIPQLLYLSVRTDGIPRQHYNLT